MSDAEQDTEILLAILSSLVVPPIPSQDVLLDALVNCKGDVEAAAKDLRCSASTDQKSFNLRKRAAQGRLDGWLDVSSLGSVTPKKRKSAMSRGGLTSESTSSKDMDLEAVETRPCLSTPLPIPRDTSSSDLVTVPPLSRLLPLTLSDPGLVKKHTPCTMHLRVLPPELACRLFYTMVNGSKGSNCL